jgi:hypothetical protein
LPELPFNVILLNNKDFNLTKRVRLVNIYNSKVINSSIHLVFSYNSSFKKDFYIQHVNIFFTKIGYKQVINVIVVGDRA